MKLVNRIGLVFCAAGALWLASCNATHETPFDKNTNWLESCASSDACGVGLQCVCGVCTSVCDRDAQCAEHDEDAVCIPLATLGNACAEDETNAAASVCSLACEESEPCTERNDGLMCVSGGCVPDPMQASADEPDASDNGDAALGDAGESFELDPQVAAEIGSACAQGFECEGRASARGITQIVPAEDGFVYWTAWGTLDELDNHRHDGAILRAEKQGGAPTAMLSDLDRPWRLWMDRGRFYWLSGEPGPRGIGRGDQTLWEAAMDGSDTALPEVTDAFAQASAHNGELYWISPYAHLEEGDSVDVQRYSFPLRTFVWSGGFYIEGDYKLAGVDDFNVYLEDGSLNLARGSVNGSGPQPFVSDTRAFMVTVGEDALWLIHVGDDDREWVSSMSKEDGAITHLGSAEDYADRPQPGESVVWLVTARPGDTRWDLWSIPKGGGERELAFGWDTEDGVAVEETDGPVWIADGDDVWVFAYGSLVRVKQL